jgi:hypothetical protein
MPFVRVVVAVELADDQRYLGILSNFSECAPLLPDSP